MKKSSVSSRGRVCLVPVECLIIRVLLRADQVINSELMSAYGGEVNRRALPYVPARGIGGAPRCGVKKLPRGIAFGQMRAIGDGAKNWRQEVGGYVLCVMKC